MTSDGNDFNYFPENQLTKFKLCSANFLISVPLRISVTLFASPGVPLDVPAFPLCHSPYLSFPFNPARGPKGALLAPPAGAFRGNKKLSYCWETVRRESMPRIAEMDVEMTTWAEVTLKCTSRS